MVLLSIKRKIKRIKIFFKMKMTISNRLLAFLIKVVNQRKIQKNRNLKKCSDN